MGGGAHARTRAGAGAAVRVRAEVRARARARAGARGEGEGQGCLHAEGGAAHGEAARARRAQVDLGQLARAVRADLAGEAVHGVGELLERGPAVLRVVLDAEVVLGAARVVRGRQQDAAVRDAALALAYDRGGRRSREQAVPPDPHAGDAVGRGHAADRLDSLPVVVPPVARHYQRAAAKLVCRQRIEDALHKVLEVVRLLEHDSLLAETGRAGLLSVKGCGRHLGHIDSGASLLRPAREAQCRPRASAVADEVWPRRSGERHVRQQHEGAADLHEHNRCHGVSHEARALVLVARPARRASSKGYWCSG